MKKTRDAKLSLLLSMLGIANKRNKKNQDSRVFAEYSEFEENLVQTYLDESKPQINEDIDALLDNNNTEKESKALAKSILSELGYGDVMSEDDLNFIWKCTGAYLSRRSKYPNGPSKISESGLNWLKSEGPDLRVSEKVWVANQLSKHTGKTILLSHHQLFSAHEKLSNSTNKPYLNSRLDALFRPYFPKIAAWFWGHEHCLVLFEDNLLDLKKGRLIGCSAFQDNVNKNEDDAYFNRTHNDIRYLDAPNTPKLRKEKGYYYHGYAVIHFEGENATTKYYDYPADIHIKANLPKVRRLIHQENL